MNPFKIAAITVLALGSVAAAPIEKFELVTAEELGASEAAFARGVVPQGVPKSFNTLAPRIEVVSPGMAKPLANPFDVVVRFVPNGDSAIDPKSLKVRYGFLRIDVTQRLLGAAKWNGNEISANGAQAPKGKHRFFVQVSDTKNRVAEAELQVVIS